MSEVCAFAGGVLILIGLALCGVFSVIWELGFVGGLFALTAVKYGALMFVVGWFLALGGILAWQRRPDGCAWKENERC